MLIGAISAIRMPRKPHACHDEPAVGGHEFEAAPKLPSREGFTNRDRLTDDELGMLHERGFVGDTHESLKTFFHAVIIPTIIGCPACAWGDIFRYVNPHH
jgi:hypothetical protein